MVVLKNPIKVLFIDHQLQRIEAFWKEVEKGFNEVFGRDFERFFQLIPTSKFSSQAETLERVLTDQPDIIFLGIGLGVDLPTGVQLAEELASLQKLHDELNYYVYANTDGDPSEFASTGKVTVCGSCSWNPSKCINLMLKTYEDIRLFGFGLELKYPMNLAQLRFAENFFREDSKERHDNEQEIHDCLRSDDHSKLNELIESFIKTRINLRAHHGYWVHSLSHFDDKLWALDRYDLLQKLYTNAVIGAIETEDLNCLGRILHSFIKFYSPEKGTKDEFGLSSENLEKLKPINNFFLFKVSSLMAGIDPKLIETIESL